MHSDNASAQAPEHFVTLFDSNFLPIGMCLHSSLMEHAQPFHLWVLCMDSVVEEQLHQLALPHVSLIPLAAVETQALLAVKPSRSTGEYCWTLTPFTAQFVFDRDASVQRVTYLDADLFFYDSPQVLLNEFEASGKHVLITDHAYARQYDQSKERGRFCVQFMTFRRTEEGMRVMTWWQDRCLEWCFSRIEDGKFGDQKYLDDWPVRFADEVHVLQQVEKTLGPWNFIKFSPHGQNIDAVFFHFHSLHITRPDKVVLFTHYRLRGRANAFYDRYLLALRDAVSTLKAQHIAIPTLQIKKKSFQWLRTVKLYLCGQKATSKL